MNDQDKDWMTGMDEGGNKASLQQGQNSGECISYKNKLLGINGNYDNEFSEEYDPWRNEDESDSKNQEMEDDLMDTLYPSIPVSTEERMKLCKPWRKAVIIKLLGRKIGYRFLLGRLTKLWNLAGSFELIDLQNDFFLVYFHESSDYDRVFFEGPWMVLRHYLTIQRWKPKFRPLEESIKWIATWIQIPDLPIEYY